MPNSYFNLEHNFLFLHNKSFHFLPTQANMYTQLNSILLRTPTILSAEVQEVPFCKCDTIWKWYLFVFPDISVLLSGALVHYKHNLKDCLVATVLFCHGSRIFKKCVFEASVSIFFTRWWFLQVPPQHRFSVIMHWDQQNRNNSDGKPPIIRR